MATIPVGLQLYSVRTECQKDLPHVFEAVKKMGYDGVEFAGYYDHSAEQLRQLLADHGLICCGAHVQWAHLQPDMLEETIEFHQTIGNPYLIVPGLPADRTGSREKWLETAELFNQIADQLRPRHLWCGYHNHHTEFGKLDGERPWDTFFRNTCSDVLMQLDTGNALRGGGRSLPILAEYPGRQQTVHLKPYQLGHDDPNDGFRPLIGEDSVPWQDIFEVCERQGGTRWYIVEYESDKYPPLEAVDRCRQALREMGK